MWWKRIVTVSLAAGLFVSVVASGVAAAEDHLIYEDGTYRLVIPGVGDFRFEVDYVDPDGDGEETVTALMAPDGYSVDDDDPDKAAWKYAATLEVEMKLNKIESKVTWGDGEATGTGEATLSFPGGSIRVTQPDAAGDFTVEATGTSGMVWKAFGSGSDWIVANNEDIKSATRFFKVEATADGIEIGAVSEAGTGFLNDLKEEEEEAVEVEFEDDDSDGAGQGKEKNEGKGKNK